MDLPGVDYPLLVTLPKLIGPDLQRLRESIEHDDPDWGWDALTAAAKQIDTPQQRARQPTTAARCWNRTDRRTTLHGEPTRAAQRSPRRPSGSRR
jgi:hypothetical protein